MTKRVPHEVDQTEVNYLKDQLDDRQGHTPAVPAIDNMHVQKKLSAIGLTNSIGTEIFHK